MHQARARAVAVERPTIPWSVRIALILAAAATFFATGIGSAFAHHGWTGYDSNTLLTVSGVIQEVQYGNPHVLVRMEVPPEPEEDGSIVDEPEMLLVVMAPPFRSESRGLPQEWLQPGAVTTFQGYLNFAETTELRAERITINDLTVELR